MLPFRADFVPKTRRGAEVLVQSTHHDFNRLTAEQQAAIRRLYRLDDPRTIAETVQGGEL